MTNLDFSPRQMRFDLSTSTVNATLAPLDFRHPVLAAELADALLHMHRSFGLAGGTAYNYRRAIVSLLRGLPESCPRTVGLGTAGSDLVEALHEWELSLATTYPPESTLPNKRGRQIRRLVQVHEANG